MSTVEKINQHARRLPEYFQKEVLDFIEFLINKKMPEGSRLEDLEWFDLSLTSAMRDIDDEDSPIYDESNLKEKWL